MDTFIRAYMDVEGYVPISIVCNYQNVVYFGVPYDNIQLKLKENAKFDIDLENDVMRLKEGWDKWLMPNPNGGKGLPKYQKQEYVDVAEGDYVDETSYQQGEYYGY